MRIISFSSVSAAPCLAMPVKALAPWFTRIRNTLGHVTPLLTKDRVAGTAQLPLALCATTASNDSSFASSLDAPALPPCQASSKVSPCTSLRVVRESDSAISPDSAGRMVISGRMADVCAELDRMALRATTP